MPTSRPAAPAIDGIWPGGFRAPALPIAVDVDEDLYGGFLTTTIGAGCSDCARRHRSSWPSGRRHFDDPRLDELLFRYRARNFPDSLSDAERRRWQAHRAERLHRGAGGLRSVQAYFEHIDELFESNSDERSQHLLGELVEYATEIVPERG